MDYYLEFILYHSELTYYLNFVEWKRNGWGLYSDTTIVSSPIGANQAFDENDYYDYIKDRKVNSRPIFIYMINVLGVEPYMVFDI